MSLAELMGNYGTRLIPGRREMRLPSWDRVPVRSLLFSRHFLNRCPTISSPSCTPTFETVESGQKTIWIAKYLQQIALLSRYFDKLPTNYESYMWGISVVVSYFWWNVYCMLLWSKLERIIFWCDAVEIVFTTCLISLENNISPLNALPLHYYILFAYASFCGELTVKIKMFNPWKLEDSHYLELKSYAHNMKPLTWYTIVTAISCDTCLRNLRHLLSYICFLL